MNIVVSKYLNARSVAADTGETVPYFLAPGDTLDVDRITNGTAIDGNSLWYHNRKDSCFYWSGGCEATDDILVNVTYSDEEMAEFCLSAANELHDEFSEKDGFLGLASGYQQTGGQDLKKIVLICYVDAKIASPVKPVPPTMNYRGVQLNTDVRDIGGCQLLTAPHHLNIEPDSALEYPMGGSISEIFNATQPNFGTRSLLVKKQNAGVMKDYLLTCYHVACSSLYKAKTYQLGGNSVFVSIPSGLVSPHAPEVFQSQVAFGEFSVSYEYALIEVDADKFTNQLGDFSFSGYYKLSEIKAGFLKNIRLLKYGAASLDTEGSFRSYSSGSIVVDETPTPNLSMSGLIEATGMAIGGDSGAPVTDNEHKLVGFIIAGRVTGTAAERCAFILPFEQLVNSISIIPPFPPSS